MWTIQRRPAAVAAAALALAATGCGALRNPMITGQKYLAEGNYERALMQFDRAIAKDQDLPFAYANRCIANDALTYHDEAIGDCTKSLELAGDTPPEGYHRYEVLNNRAVAFINVRRRDEARKDLDEALALKPDYAEAIANIGRLYIDQDDFATAIDKLTEALKLNDTMSQAYGNRGFAYQNLGDNLKAVADYDKAISIDNNISAWQNRGMLNYTLGRFDAAYSDFQSILRLADKNSEAYYMASAQVQLLESRPTGRADDPLTDYTPDAPDPIEDATATSVVTDTVGAAVDDGTATSAP